MRSEPQVQRDCICPGACQFLFRKSHSEEGRILENVAKLGPFEHRGKMREGRGFFGSSTLKLRASLQMKLFRVKLLSWEGSY